MLIADPQGIGDRAVALTIGMPAAYVFEQLRILFDGFAVAFFGPEIEILSHVGVLLWLLRVLIH